MSVSSLGLNPYDVSQTIFSAITTSIAEEDCGICRDVAGSNFSGPEESTDRVITLHCNHTFCRECVTAWVPKQPEANCPTCREGFNEDDTFNYYLGAEVESPVEKVEGITCAFCLNPVGHNPAYPENSVVTLSCHPDHQFCRHCIKKYITVQLGEKCPSCAKWMKMQELENLVGRKLYLVTLLRTAFLVPMLLTLIVYLVLRLVAGAVSLLSSRIKILYPFNFPMILLCRICERIYRAEMAALNWSTRFIYRIGEPVSQ